MTDLPWKIHPKFIPVWAAWTVANLVAALWPNVWLLVGLWLYFGAFEWVGRSARTTTLKATFSEAFIWCQRRLSKHRDLLKGWNALLFFPVLLIIGWNVYETGRAFERPVWISAAIAALIVTGLCGHLLWTDKNG